MGLHATNMHNFGEGLALAQAGAPHWVWDSLASFGPHAVLTSGDSTGAGRGPAWHASRYSMAPDLCARSATSRPSMCATDSAV
jgi:hypothetical protein